MPTSPEQLADLLARTALGDRRSFELLYQASAAHLYGLVLRIVRQKEIADEVLQESYVKIWNRAGDFNPDKAGAMTWMGVIARNQAIDTLRRGNQQPNSIDDPVEDLHWLADDNPGPDEQVHSERRSAAIHHCLDQLEGSQKQAVIMAFFNGLTHDELAARLQTPLGTVKSWIRRGLQRLKQCLDGS